MKKLASLIKTFLLALITGSAAIYLMANSDDFTAYVQSHYSLKQQIIPTLIAVAIYIVGVGFACLSVRFFASISSMCSKKAIPSKDFG